MIIQGTKVQKFIGYFNRDPRNFYQYLLAAKKGSHHGRSLRRTGEIPFTTSTHNAVGGPVRGAPPPRTRPAHKTKPPRPGAGPPPGPRLGRPSHTQFTPSTNPAGGPPSGPPPPPFTGRNLKTSPPVRSAHLPRPQNRLSDRSRTCRRSGWQGSGGSSRYTAGSHR